MIEKHLKQRYTGVVEMVLTSVTRLFLYVQSGCLTDLKTVRLSAGLACRLFDCLAVCFSGWPTRLYSTCQFLLLACLPTYHLSSSLLSIEGEKKK